jgi:hypothetical protein
MFLWFLEYKMFLYMLSIQWLIKHFYHSYVGRHWPLGFSPIQRWGEAMVVAGWDVDDYKAIEKNLEGLTTDISDILINEILRHYQCHTIGLSGSLSRLIHGVAWAVVCYHEKHPWCYFVEAMGFIFWYFGLFGRKTSFCKTFYIYIYMRLLPSYFGLYTTCDVWLDL